MWKFDNWLYTNYGLLNINHSIIDGIHFGSLKVIGQSPLRKQESQTGIFLALSAKGLINKFGSQLQAPVAVETRWAQPEISLTWWRAVPNHLNQIVEVRISGKFWRKFNGSFLNFVSWCRLWTRKLSTLQLVCDLLWKWLSLTLCMLGNFLKIDYIVVCFLKTFKFCLFLMGNDGLSSQQVGSQASSRVTRLLAWIQPVCISINAVPFLCRSCI